jgi:hypothetical protein
VVVASVAHAATAAQQAVSRRRLAESVSSTIALSAPKFGCN